MILAQNEYRQQKNSPLYRAGAIGKDSISSLCHGDVAFGGDLLDALPKSGNAIPIQLVVWL
jgi:uncharacterized protein (DUF302 family)